MKIHHGLLTALGPQTTRRVVVVEEAVEPGAVDVDVGRVDEARAPGARAIHLRVGAVGEGRVGPGGLRGEGHQRRGVALVVRGFVLDESGEVVGGVDVGVAVELRVFAGRAVEPGWSWAGDQEAPGSPKMMSG